MCKHRRSLYSFLSVYSVIFPVFIFDIRLVKRHIFPSASIQCDAPRTGRFCAFKLLRTSCLINQIIKCCVCLLLMGSGWQRLRRCDPRQPCNNRFPLRSTSRAVHCQGCQSIPVKNLCPPSQRSAPQPLPASVSGRSQAGG